MSVISTKSDAAPSTRVLRALAAFGLSLSECRDARRAEIRVWMSAARRVVRQAESIAAIVGPSGSGKSGILRSIERIAMERGDGVVRVSLTGPMDEWQGAAGRGRTVVEMPGTTLGEAISLLARVGLAEPRLFALRPDELSDGQRARFRLALAIRDALGDHGSHGRRVWMLVDEFGSGLDVTTARGVACALARLIRRHAGLRAVVCVNDERVLPWFEPGLELELSLGAMVRVRGGREHPCG